MAALRVAKGALVHPVPSVSGVKLVADRAYDAPSRDVKPVALVVVPLYG